MRYIGDFGYAEILYECESVSTRFLTYVPLHKNKKVIVYEIENIMNEDVEAEILYQFEPVLGVAREYTKKHLVIKRCENYVSVKNSYRDSYQYEVVKIYVDRDFELLDSDDKMVRLQTLLKIKAGEKAKITIEISVDDTIEPADEVQDLQEIHRFWDETLRKSSS